MSVHLQQVHFLKVTEAPRSKSAARGSSSQGPGDMDRPHGQQRSDVRMQLS
jgi:hypothetical protein